MTADEENDRGPRGALVFLGLATTLAIIDSTIVNVALPSSAPTSDCPSPRRSGLSPGTVWRLPPC